MRHALDTNFMVYFEGVDDPERQVEAWQFLDTLDPGDVAIPVQALSGLFNVLTREAKWPAARARAAVLTWTETYETIETTPGILLDAMGLAQAHQLAIWDAIAGGRGGGRLPRAAVRRKRKAFRRGHAPRLRLARRHGAQPVPARSLARRMTGRAHERSVMRRRVALRCGGRR